MGVILVSAPPLWRFTYTQRTHICLVPFFQGNTEFPQVIYREAKDAVMKTDVGSSEEFSSFEPYWPPWLMMHYADIINLIAFSILTAFQLCCVLGLVLVFDVFYFVLVVEWNNEAGNKRCL